MSGHRQRRSTQAKQQVATGRQKYQQKKKRRLHLYAATPPIESLRAVISTATTGAQEKVIIVNDVSRALVYAFCDKDMYVELCDDDRAVGEEHVCRKLVKAVEATRTAVRNMATRGCWESSSRRRAHVALRVPPHGLGHHGIRQATTVCPVDHPRTCPEDPQTLNLRDIECFPFFGSRVSQEMFDFPFEREDGMQSSLSMSVRETGEAGGQWDGKKLDNKGTGKHLLHRLQLVSGACPYVHDLATVSFWTNVHTMESSQDAAGLFVVGPTGLGTASAPPRSRGRVAQDRLQE